MIKLTIAAIVMAVIVATIGFTSQPRAIAQAPGAPPAPQNVAVVDGPNLGEATLSWTAVEGIASYRIGWLSEDNLTMFRESWRERFGYSDVSASSSFTLNGLAPGKQYHFIVGSRRDDQPIGWSGWAGLTLAGTAVCPAAGVGPAPAQAQDYDVDNDGLIDVSNLAQLDAMRYDLDGDGSASDPKYFAAFPNAMQGMGCPTTAGFGLCEGYELAADLDFDTNGNGRPDAGDEYWNEGKGWLPIGTVSNRWATDFDGNHHTISNLYINRTNNRDRIAEYVGLFGYNAAGTRINRVGVRFANVTGAYSAAGLIAENYGEIASSYVTGVIRGRASVGGLVGRNYGAISGSYAVGNISGVSNIGGLVGFNLSNGRIADTYAKGRVASSIAAAGGLVGPHRGAIKNSYSTSRISGQGGGLVGNGSLRELGTAEMSYWDTTSSRAADSASGVGKTTAELQLPTANTGIYAEWDPEVWDFGTSEQYPALKHGGLDIVAQRN